jgi:hypothetical protein
MNRLLAGISNDQTARLWNLDTTYLQVGPPIQHEESASPYGKVLVTGGGKDVYAWDIHAIFKRAGLKYLLLPDVNITTLQ